MKFKILRNVTLGIGCLMLSLTLSSNLVHDNVGNKPSHIIQITQGMPYGMAQSRHVIHPMQEMPFSTMQEMPFAMQEMPFGMIQSI